jgi:type II secretory pathway component PulM
MTAWPRLLQRSSVREQRLIVAAAVVVVAALLYVFAWQPIVADIDRVDRDLPQARGVLDTARAQADSIVALERAPAPVPASSQQPLTVVERVLAERNLRQIATALDAQEGRVRLTFAAVRFDAIPGLLDALQRSGLRASEATIAQRVEAGMVRAEFAFVRA